MIRTTGPRGEETGERRPRGEEGLGTRASESLQTLRYLNVQEIYKNFQNT